VVKILCSFGAATNKALIVDASDTGLIPLHAAAKNGHFEVPPAVQLMVPDVQYCSIPKTRTRITMYYYVYRIPYSYRSTWRTKKVLQSWWIKVAIQFAATNSNRGC
jgi:hypothetical protein